VIERKGNRSYVTERLPDVVVTTSDARKSFVRELFETRRVLEVPIIELAAERASDAERSAIGTLAGRFQAGMELREFRRLDRLFHAAIAGASRNQLLVEIHAKVLARLFGSPEVDELLSSRRNRREVRGIVEESVGHHQGIAAAIVAGDPARAADAGSTHLRAVERRMLDRLV
jgi:GntR family transcriptional repressor for pyruvate dehydrogenase complex